MQHGSAAVTVTPENCADAILDVRRVIDRLWQNTIERNLILPYKVILRVVELYASNGNKAQRQTFEDSMRTAGWRGTADERQARVSEIIVEAGLRTNWQLAIHQSPEIVEQTISRDSGADHYRLGRHAMTKNPLFQDAVPPWLELWGVYSLYSGSGT